MATISIDSALLKARSHTRKGELDQARSMLQEILNTFPNNKRARRELEKLRTPEYPEDLKRNPSQEQLDKLAGLYNTGHMTETADEAQKLTHQFPHSFILFNILGAAKMALGISNTAEVAFRKASNINPDFPDAHNNLGNALKAQGKLNEAISSYRRAIQLKPNYIEALNNFGNVLLIQGKTDQAALAYKKALSLNPNIPEVHFNLGNTLKGQKKFEAAIASYHRAVELNPHYSEAYFNIGFILNEQKKYDEAIFAYKQAIAIDPGYSEAINNIGLILQDQKKNSEAIDFFDQAIQLNPSDSQLFFNLGNTLYSLGRIEETIDAYKSAIRIRPTYHEAYNNLGSLLQQTGRLDEAIRAHAQAIQIFSDFAEAHYNMGNAFNKLGQIDNAIISYKRAINIKPHYAQAFHNLAMMYQQISRHPESISAYREALSINPDYASAEIQLLHQQQYICDFTIAEKLPEAASRLGITTDPVPPFPALSWVDNAESHLTRTKIWSSHIYKYRPSSLIKRPEKRPERLKIGYFSADFHNHATMYLMAGLLREHDRKQFEVYAYSYGLNKSGEWRNRAKRNIDRFFDVTELTDLQVKDLVRGHNLDIAIDLKGHTMHSRSEIFQYRLAPIQINYLGYPGSMGADFIDYIVADPVVIPEHQRQYYSEKIIYLPHTYQPNDNTREIAETNTSRSDAGLPNDAFVFCCFNNSYKITPCEFDIWMRILEKVAGSVLWLLKSNQWAEQTLLKEAQKRGIDPSRLIFAPHLPHKEHLGRHKHADLFIDTFNCNAHTTASDALWGGLPVVTKKGQQFAARVGASLLNAAGLNELITSTEIEYEELILELAANPEKLASIKEKLGENREKKPLFSTSRYTKNFEQGLLEAYTIYSEGQPPKHIFVKDQNIDPQIDFINKSVIKEFSSGSEQPYFD